MKKKPPIPKEYEILAKYPSVLNKFKDTIVVLNAFKYIEIDTTYFKGYYVIFCRDEVAYDTAIYDSLVWYKYQLHLLNLGCNNVLYFYLYSMKSCKSKTYTDREMAFLYKTMCCVNYIKDTLHIKDKLNQREIYQLAIKLTFEKHLRESKYDINKVKHVSLFDDKENNPIEQRFIRNLIDNNTHIFYNNKELYHYDRKCYDDKNADSIDYFFENYNCYLIETISKKISDTTGLFPIICNFDSLGILTSLKFKKNIKGVNQNKLVEEINKKPSLIKYHYQPTKLKIRQ